MNVRRIVVLLVLVAALGTWIWVREIPQAERESKKEKLLAVDPNAVTGIALVYPDREIELRKDNAGWRLVKPADAPADDTIVKSLVATLTGAEVQKTLDEPPKDLAAFGLDKPKVVARLTLKDGAQPPPIAVGKNTAIGGKTYIRKGDEPKLYLTTSSVGYGLDKQPKDLREKQILTFKDDDVTRVEIRPEGRETVALVRKQKDAWTVDPGDHPADPTEVRSYLASLRSTRALDFPADAPTDLAQYGLGTPRLAVTVTGKDGTGTETLLVGAEKTEGSTKQIYVKRADRPAVYAVGEWSYRTLDKGAGQFRDKTVLGFDPARVAKAVLERKDGGGATFARADGTWRIEGGGDKKPKTSAIQGFVDDVRDLRGSDVAAEPPGDLARFGLAAPDLRVTLSDKDGQPIGTVLAAKQNGKYYVMHAGGETVFEARDYMYARLDKHDRDFVETPPPPGASTTMPPAAEGEEPADDMGGDEEAE